MNRITIIGQGNVGTHLCIALAGTTDELISVSSRTLEELPTDSDIYIIAVSDSAIEEVASRLPQLNGIVAHTSGSVSINVLNRFNRYGVFYPLQTFTKGADIDYSRIPVFIEGSDTAVSGILMGAASLFSSNLHHADSTLRLKLHIASVFACNYANHLWHIADSLLQEEGLSMEVIRPLIETSVEKLRHMPPHKAQTGPAVRRDMNVLDKHMQQLSSSPYEQIYKILADSILNTHKTI